MSVKSIREIKEELKQIPPERLPEYLALYRDDGRKGVQDVLKTQENRLKKYEAELARIQTLTFFEKKYEEYTYICGIDEVGRGPLAGPVVAGAVILPKDCRILYINDSKKLSQKRGRSCRRRFTKKRSPSVSGCPRRRGLTRSISCRQPTRRCERPFGHSL